jgi:hypothetical protein
MTYDQYQQLYGAAKEQIAARVAQVQPTAGNGASVNGMGIAVEVPVADEAAAAEEEDWFFSLIGDFTITRDSSEDPSRVFFQPNQQLASAGRTTGNFIAPNYWEQSQIFNIIVPPVDPEPGYTFSRSVKIAFRSSSRDRGDETGFKFPVRLVIDMVEVSGTGAILDVVNTYTFRLGFSGVTKNFVAPSSDAFFYLSLKSLERVD